MVTNTFKKAHTLQVINVRDGCWLLIGIMVVSALIGGCKPSSQAPASPPPLASATRPVANPPLLPAGKVQVHAYINVSSGCQAATVALLDELVKENAAYVDYQITDFGTSEGAKEWLKTGLGCMAILFNGSPAVALEGPGGQRRIVIFKMPVGLGLWTHEDLRATFSAIRRGKFRSATEQEVAEYFAPMKVDVTVTAQRVEDLDRRGQRYGQVVMDGKIVMVFKHSRAGKSSVQRAAAAAKTLSEWLTGPVQPEDVDIAEVDDGFELLVGGIAVAVATAKDAQDYELLPKQLCVSWAKNISQTVLMARARKRLQQQSQTAAAAHSEH